VKNSELDQLLKSIGQPERPANYWEDFPKQVMAEIRKPEASVRPAGLRRRPAFWTWPRVSSD